jgi:hypothetical protein
MFETIVVIIIVAVAAILVGRSVYRSTMARATGCACKDECPLSEMCNPESGDCVENIRGRASTPGNRATS